MHANISEAPFKIYNIGNNKTVKLMDIVKFYEKNFRLKAKKFQRYATRGRRENLCKYKFFKKNIKVQSQNYN